MNLLCIKSLFMSDDPTDNPYRVFTKGKRYTAHNGVFKDAVTGAKDEPLASTPVLIALNDYGDNHIIKYRDEKSLDTFFAQHFKEQKASDAVHD